MTVSKEKSHHIPDYEGQAKEGIFASFGVLFCPKTLASRVFQQPAAVFIWKSSLILILYLPNMKHNGLFCRK